MTGWRGGGLVRRIYRHVRRFIPFSVLYWCDLGYLVNLTYVYCSTDKFRTWFTISTRLHNIINAPILWSRVVEYKYYNMKPKIWTDIPRDTVSPVNFLFTFKFEYYGDRKLIIYYCTSRARATLFIPEFPRRTVKTTTLHTIWYVHGQYIILYCGRQKYDNGDENVYLNPFYASTPMTINIIQAARLAGAIYSTDTLFVFPFLYCTFY